MRYDATNHPVTVACGATLEEATQTLYDSRFVKTRGGTGWTVAVESFVVSVP